MKIGVDEHYWVDAITLARVEVAVEYLEQTDSPSNPDRRPPYQTSSEAPRSNHHQIQVKAVDEEHAGVFTCNFELSGWGVEKVRFERPSRQDDFELVRKCVSLQKSNKNSSCKSIFTISHSDSGGRASYSIRVCLLWRNARSLLEAQSSKQNDILGYVTPSCGNTAPESWSPRDFYDNVHVPVKENEEVHFKVDGLECQLYPFQKRAVRWLLNREAVDLTADGIKHSARNSELPLGFTQAQDVDGQPIYLNPWLGLTTTSRNLLNPHWEGLCGGILAEEMGLGKTVEVISLILLHQRNMEQEIDSSDSSLRQSKTTLIVAPDSILQQWESELHVHAPALKVMVYEGVKAATKKVSEEEATKKLLDQDVVLTTYRVLSKEIHYSKDVPERDLRHAKQYARKMSPLVKLHWWRVVLDECQMVESGVNQAARVVNQIPRRNAWAVSGTPVKKDANDLLGLLTFLRLAPYYWSSNLWNRLIEKHKDIAKELFRSIALRHSKEQVKKDIQLPPQKRIVITVPFSQIEEQNYSDLFQQMCDECGLDLKGAPTTDEWDPSDTTIIERMRSWLVRLRQVCLHPEVGGRNRKALGGEGPLRTVGEVLQVMIDQNEAAMRSEERNLYISRLKRGQLFEHAKRPQDALEVWDEVHQLAQQAVIECRKDYQRAVESEASDAKTDEDSSESRLGVFRMRLRSALEVEHMSTFFTANAYFQIKTDEELTKPDSDEFKELEKKEAEMYEKAKRIRAEMLTETQAKADGFMNTIRERSKAKEFASIPNFKDIPVSGGIESRDTIQRAQRLFDVLNRQTETLDEWREELKNLLLMPLVDQDDDELQGDEYETSTKQQDKVYAYMEAVRALVSDRRDAFSGLENFLIKEETKTSLKNAEKGEGHAPELAVPMLQKRLELKPGKNLRSIRGILAELRAMKTTFKSQEERGSYRAAAELQIINSALYRLQQESTKHGKVIIELENEVGLYRDAMNARLDYYRQLQGISDTVAPLEEDITDLKLEQMDRVDAKANAKIATLKSRARYLAHLQDDSSAAEVERKCLICREESFEIGTLTVCGHAFCKECLNLWLKSSSKCPICKKHLRPSDLHQITYKPSELTMLEETNSQSSSNSPSASHTAASSPRTDASDSAIYAGISHATLAEIKNIDLSGAFGTKIDTLARHILWLRRHDTGAKSILFSQFRDFLDVLEQAFAKFGIRCTGIERRAGVEKFQHDPAVECFFLHARAHASGLNLVHATHVFLCEPLLNTALELQAIARVHRIGQHHPTTVWMYLVQGSVEQAIYDISVRRRLAHISREDAAHSSRKGKSKKQKRKEGEDLEDDIEKANSREMQEAPLARLLAGGKSGGEVVQNDDLWDCLFSASTARAAGQAALVGSGGGDEAERMATAFLAGEAAEERQLAHR